MTRTGQSHAALLTPSGLLNWGKWREGLFGVSAALAPSTSDSTPGQTKPTAKGKGTLKIEGTGSSTQMVPPKYGRDSGPVAVSFYIHMREISVSLSFPVP